MTCCKASRFVGHSALLLDSCIVEIKSLLGRDKKSVRVICIRICVRVRVRVLQVEVRVRVTFRVRVCGNMLRFLLLRGHVLAPCLS